MRTALRRARRLGAFLLIAMTAWWVVQRRRSPVRWIEPPAVPPGGLPADVLATDAGLTAIPDDLVPVPGEAVVAEPVVDVSEPVVDVSDVDEALADAPPAEGEAVVAEPVLDASEPVSDASEPAVGASEPVVDVSVDDPTETELEAPERGIDEPTMTIARDTVAVPEEETGTRIPMPTFSEAPTMEIPAVTDNLRAVRGIGPSMERLLHGLGIISFRQLAMLDGVELERVRAELSDFRTRIEREDWVGQARALHKEKYGRDPA